MSKMLLPTKSLKYAAQRTRRLEVLLSVGQLLSRKCKVD